MQDLLRGSGSSCENDEVNIEEVLKLSWLWVIDVCSIPFLDNPLSDIFFLQLPTNACSEKGGGAHHACASRDVPLLCGNSLVSLVAESYSEQESNMSPTSDIRSEASASFWRESDSTPCFPAENDVVQAVVLGLLYGILVYHQVPSKEVRSINDVTATAAKRMGSCRLDSPVTGGSGSCSKWTTQYSVAPGVGRHTARCTETVSKDVQTAKTREDATSVATGWEMVYVSPPTAMYADLYPFGRIQDRPPLVLLECLSACILQYCWSDPKRVAGVLRVVVRALDYLSVALETMECETQERFIGDILPWLISWTGIIQSEPCVVSVLDGSIEVIFFKVLCVLRSSTFTHPSKLRPISMFCKTLLETRLTSSVHDPATKDDQRRFVLLWFATGRSSPGSRSSNSCVEAPHLEQQHTSPSCSHCCSPDTCYSYSALQTRSALQHDFMSGASLRPFLVAAIFLKAVCWVTIDALSVQDLFSASSSLDHPDALQHQVCEEASPRVPDGLSRDGVVARQAAVELLLALWMYRYNEESHDDSQSDRFSFRCAICLLLGRTFVSHLTDIGRVAAVQPILSYLSVPCPVEWCRLIDEAYAASPPTSSPCQSTELRNDEKTSSPPPQSFSSNSSSPCGVVACHRQTVRLTCRAFYILQWLRRFMQRMLPSVPLVASQRHIQRTIGLCFTEEVFQTLHPPSGQRPSLMSHPPEFTTPSLLSTLLSIPTGLELLVLLLDPVTLRQTSFLASEVSQTTIKQSFHWFIAPDNNLLNIKAETFARFPTILTVITSLARNPTLPRLGLSPYSGFLRAQLSSLPSLSSLTCNSNSTTNASGLSGKVPSAYSSNTEGGSVAGGLKNIALSSTCRSIPGVLLSDTCTPSGCDSIFTDGGGLSVMDASTSHERDMKYTKRLLFGMTYSELARQLVMTAEFHRMPPSRTLLARVRRTILEDWCFDHFTPIFNWTMGSCSPCLNVNSISSPSHQPTCASSGTCKRRLLTNHCCTTTTTMMISTTDPLIDSKVQHTNSIDLPSGDLLIPITANTATNTTVGDKPEENSILESPLSFCSSSDESGRLSDAVSIVRPEKRPPQVQTQLSEQPALSSVTVLSETSKLASLNNSPCNPVSDTLSIDLDCKQQTSSLPVEGETNNHDHLAPFHAPIAKSSDGPITQDATLLDHVAPIKGLVEESLSTTSLPSSSHNPTARSSERPNVACEKSDAFYFLHFKGSQIPEWALQHVLLQVCLPVSSRSAQPLVPKEYVPTLMGTWLWDVLKSVTPIPSEEGEPKEKYRKQALPDDGRHLLASQRELYRPDQPSNPTIRPADFVVGCHPYITQHITGMNTPLSNTPSLIAKERPSILPLTNCHGVTVVHPLASCLLRFLSLFLETWTRELGHALLASTCLGFVEFSLYQLQCGANQYTSERHQRCVSKKRGLSPKHHHHHHPLLLSTEDLDTLDYWSTALPSISVSDDPFKAMCSTASTLRQLITSDLTSYYLTLCRKTLVGRLLIMCGIEPQMLLRATTTQLTAFAETCSQAVNKSQQKTSLYPRSRLHYCSPELRRALSPALFPLVGRELIENSLQLHDPPFIDSHFPIMDILLHVIAEAFRILFLRLPRLWAGMNLK